MPWCGTLPAAIRVGWSDPTTPAGAAGTAAVQVTNPNGQSVTLNSGFTYTAPAPTLTSVSPTSGPTAGGTQITLTGSNFV